MNTTFRTAVVALALVAAACGSGDTATTAPTADDAATESVMTIDVVNVAFKPDTVKVLRSTTVRWVNRDGGVRHTATSGTPGEGGVAGVSDAKPSKPDGTFDGDLPDAGADFSFTFEDTGTFAYFCEVHPSMTGTVVVE